MFTRPRYYLYIEPLKGGQKCTEDADILAELTDVGTTDTEGGGTDE